jgi:hypothetical protein
MNGCRQFSYPTKSGLMPRANCICLTVRTRWTIRSDVKKLFGSLGESAEDEIRYCDSVVSDCWHRRRYHLVTYNSWQLGNRIVVKAA